MERERERERVGADASRLAPRKKEGEMENILYFSSLLINRD